MTDRIVLRLSGAPRGKGRTRPRPGTKDIFVKPKADRIAEAVLINAWEELGEPHMPDDVALRVLVVLAVERPQSHFKKDGSLTALGARHPVPRNKKPDTDNAIKLVMDSMNKRAYRDDVLVAEHAVIRRWADWPETMVVIEPVHDLIP